MAAPEHSSKDEEIVLVTGASGFIASHIVDLLMRSGYRVRGTVRSLTNEVKIRPLLSLGPGAKYPLELVEADLNDHESWDRAVRGCRYVQHVASPFPAVPPEHEDEIIRPAVNGTLSVLQACHKYRVKRVVLTSSIAAIFGDFANRDPPGKVFTEEDWTDAETAKDAYIKSKTMTERAAWEFVAQLPENERFELTVLNPTGVFGPLLCGVPGTTALIPKKLMTREMLLIPRFNLGVVDVRDVALAHLRAMTLTEAIGRRIIVHSGTNMWIEDVAKILEHEFDPQEYSVPTTRCPYWLLKLMAVADKEARMLLPSYNKEQKYDNSKMRSILEITPSDVRLSITDMVYSLIEKGFIKKTKKYRGPPNDNNSPLH